MVGSWRTPPSSPNTMSRLSDVRARSWALLPKPSLAYTAWQAAWGRASWEVTSRPVPREGAGRLGGDGRGGGARGCRRRRRRRRRRGGGRRPGGGGGVGDGLRRLAAAAAGQRQGAGAGQEPQGAAAVEEAGQVLGQ